MANNKIVAYHGTIKQKAHIILSSGQFLKSPKPTEWLGNGVYFYAYRKHAAIWAQRQVNKIENQNLERNPIILNAELSYTDEQVLDLDNPEQRQVFEEEVNEAWRIANNYLRSLKDTNFDSKSRRWCAACNLFRNMHPEIGITFYTFSTYSQYDHNLIFGKNERQICVNVCSIITNIKEG